MLFEIARQYESNRDSLIIVAGACQSHFEALLRAGANFASSPARILIHALDPLCIAAKAVVYFRKDTISMLGYCGLDGDGLGWVRWGRDERELSDGVPGIQHTEESYLISPMVTCINNMKRQNIRSCTVKHLPVI